MEKKLITILGPTASGKTALAVSLAQKLAGEIISADSRQVYRDMTIGTGKDLDDYIVNGQPIPHHLIDICDAGTKYNLFQFQHDFRTAYNDICRRNAQPILCGGTGFYIEAVLKGYNLHEVPRNEKLRLELKDKTLEQLTEILINLKRRTQSTLHNKTDLDSCQRAIRAIEIETFNLRTPVSKHTFLPIQSLIFGINIDRNIRRQRITQRLKERLDNGLIEEVRSLLNRGISAEALIYYGLEYKYITEHIIGKSTLDQTFRALETAIHQFAKRQMTWFRGMERRGFKINWLDAEMPNHEKTQTIISMIEEPK